MLQLPEGVWVRSMYYDFDSDSIRVRLESDSFPITEHEEGGWISDPFIQPMLVRPSVSMDIGEVPAIIQWEFPKDEHQG